MINPRCTCGATHYKDRPHSIHCLVARQQNETEAVISWLRTVRKAAATFPDVITLSASGTFNLCDRAIKLLEKKPMSQQKIRLAHIYLEQADVARQQSDLEGSISAFTKAIDIYKGMAIEEPACWNLVADTIEKAAATYKAAGKLDLAKECLTEAAQIRETLAKSEEPAPESE